MLPDLQLQKVRYEDYVTTGPRIRAITSTSLEEARPFITHAWLGGTNKPLEIMCVGQNNIGDGVVRQKTDVLTRPPTRRISYAAAARKLPSRISNLRVRAA